MLGRGLRQLGTLWRGRKEELLIQRKLLCKSVPTEIIRRLLLLTYEYNYNLGMEVAFETGEGGEGTWWDVDGIWDEGAWGGEARDISAICAF